MPYWNEPGLTWDHPLARYDDPRTIAQTTNQPKPMNNVVLDANSNLSTTDYIARVRALITGASVQPAFAPLAAFLTGLGNKVALLEDQENALTAAKNTLTAATLSRDEARDSVEASLPALAAKLGESATSEQDIINAGARLKDAPTKRPAPGTPQGLELTTGDEDGELTGHCEGQPGLADYYEIQYTPGDPLQPATTWQFADTAKKSTFELHGLPSGQKIWVRLRAVNTTGKSNWSDPACKRVP